MDAFPVSAQMFWRKVEVILTIGHYEALMPCGANQHQLFVGKLFSLLPQRIILMLQVELFNRHTDI